MAGPNAQTGGATTTPAGVMPDADDASWAALQKELEGTDELLSGETEEPLEETAEPADEGDEGEPEAKEPKARPTYEELDRNYRNTTAALREAREQRKADREQLASITKLIEGLQARRQQQLEPTVQQPEPPKAPSVEEDPIGYFQHKIAEQAKVIEQLQNGTQQTVQQVTQRQQFNDFLQAVERSEVAIRATTPDYDAACEHLERGRIAELEIMLPDNSPQAMALARQAGLENPEQLRLQMLNNDRINVAQHALRTGQSPAQVYYNLAKTRGYAAKAAPAPRGQNGQFAKTKELEQAEQKLETARRGHRAAKSIGGGSGAAENELNLADLTDLYEEDPEAFDREWEKMARTGRLG